MVDDCRYEELKANFKAMQTTLKLVLPIEILKYAASIYTPVIFKMFPSEVCKAYDCDMHIFCDVGLITEYKITSYRKHFEYDVKYNSSNGTIICSCKKCEFVGVFCSHALKVLSSRNIMKTIVLYM